MQMASVMWVAHVVVVEVVVDVMQTGVVQVLHYDSLTETSQC